MYIGLLVMAISVCVCLSVPCRIPTLGLLHGPRYKLGEWFRVPSIVVHYWADLQLVHRFCCYDSMALNAKCQRVLVLTLYLV